MASLEESSFHAFTSAVNNTNYSSYRVELLSLDNLPTVVKGCLLSTGFALVCVDRFIKVLRFSMSTFALFLSSSCVSCFSVSTGFALVYVDRFKVFRFSMSIFALFPVYMSTGLCNYGVMFFYVIFNPDVSMYIL